MKPTETIKLVIHLQRRPDGGLRAWSDEVPGLVLSHRDADKVLADIVPAVEIIMSEVLGATVTASELRSASSMGLMPRKPLTLGGRLAGTLARLRPREETREYVAACMA